MKTPFWCVLVAIFLPYTLAGVASYFKIKQFGSIDNHHPRAQATALEGAGARTYGAQLNAWEALVVFGLAVVVAHLAGADPGASSLASVIFLVARVLHAVFYISDMAPLRTLMFVVASVCCLWLFGLAVVA
jgi:uncharacterized MAPEG superfamily protein